MADREDRQREWRAAIEAASDEASLKQVESLLFGKKGEVLLLLKSVSSLPAEERPAAGRAANELKIELQARLEKRREELAQQVAAQELSATGFDPTEPDRYPPAEVFRKVEALYGGAWTHTLGDGASSRRIADDLLLRLKEGRFGRHAPADYHLDISRSYRDDGLS